MKKLIIACAFLASTSMVSFAQSATPASNASVEKMASSRAQTYQKQLGLTKEQYDLVYKAEVNYFTQEQRAGGHVGPGQGYQMQLGRDQQYKNALTAEQYAKYDASRPKPVMPGQPAPASH